MKFKTIDPAVAECLEELTIAAKDRRAKVKEVWSRWVEGKLAICANFSDNSTYGRLYDPPKGYEAKMDFAIQWERELQKFRKELGVI